MLIFGNIFLINVMNSNHILLKLFISKTNKNIQNYTIIEATGMYKDKGVSTKKERNSLLMCDPQETPAFHYCPLKYK